MKKCLVSPLVDELNMNEDVAEYFDKGMFIFDNTITPSQSDARVNKLYIKNGAGTVSITCEEGSDKFTRDGFSIVVSQETPANTKYHFLYPLDGWTLIEGISGSGASALKSNFMLRLNDVIRSYNLTRFNAAGITMDKYDLEALGALTKLEYIGIGGAYNGSWSNNTDIVNLANKFIDNGIDLTANRIVVIGDGGGNWRLNVNGTPYARYIHIVFNQSGYNIYAEVNSSTALADYSELTPVYTKTL